MSDTSTRPGATLDRLSFRHAFQRQAEQLVRFMHDLGQPETAAAGHDPSTLACNVIEMLDVIEGDVGQSLVLLFRRLAPDVADEFEAMREPTCTRAYERLEKLDTWIRRAAAREMAASAARAGVNATVQQLLDLISTFPLKRVVHLPAEYASSIASFQAAGIDLNDPNVWEDGEAMTVQQAIDRGLL